MLVPLAAAIVPLEAIPAPAPAVDKLPVTEILAPAPVVVSVVALSATGFVLPVPVMLMAVFAVKAPVL